MTAGRCTILLVPFRTRSHSYISSFEFENQFHIAFLLYQQNSFCQERIFYYMPYNYSAGIRVSKHATYLAVYNVLYLYISRLLSEA